MRISTNRVCFFESSHFCTQVQNEFTNVFFIQFQNEFTDMFCTQFQNETDMTNALQLC